MARTQFTFTFTNAQPGADVHFSAPVYPDASTSTPDGPTLVLSSANAVSVWADAGFLVAVSVDGNGNEISATATAGSPTVSTDSGTAGTSPFGSGGSVPDGSVLPVADTTGVTLDTTTYDNPVTGGPDKLAVLVFPDTGGNAQVMLGVAIEGDAFPRQLYFANPSSDGADFGDGTADPWNAQSAGWAAQANGDGTYNFAILAHGSLIVGTPMPNVGHGVRVANGALQLGASGSGDSGVAVQSGVGAPDTFVGGSVGDLYIRTDGGALTTIYQCTVAGAAGVATWAGIL